MVSEAHGKTQKLQQPSGSMNSYGVYWQRRLQENKMRKNRINYDYPTQSMIELNQLVKTISNYRYGNKFLKVLSDTSWQKLYWLGGSFRG